MGPNYSIIWLRIKIFAEGIRSYGYEKWYHGQEIGFPGQEIVSCVQEIGFYGQEKGSQDQEIGFSWLGNKVS